MLNYFSRMTDGSKAVKIHMYNRVHNSDCLKSCFKTIFGCLRRSFHDMSS